MKQLNETVLAEWPDRPMLTALATAFPFLLQKFSISFLSLLNFLLVFSNNI